jgi:hypothetical protein
MRQQLKWQIVKRLLRPWPSPRCLKPSLHDFFSITLPVRVTLFLCAYSASAMSADHGSSSHANAVLGASSKRSPTVPSSKASVAPPKVTGDERVELKDMLPAAPALPVEEDIMQLARMGELGAIQRLIDEDHYTVNFMDEEGITPLHVMPPILRQ